MDASQPVSDVAAPSVAAPSVAAPSVAAPSVAAPSAAVTGTRVPSLAEAGYEELRERRPAGLLRRYLTTNRHLIGLLFGALVDYTRTRPREERRGLKFRTMQVAALLVRPVVKHSLVKKPFPVQLRRRLELLGPTYIKLGQVLSLREDLLPREVTSELKNLLNRLPAVPYERYLELVAEGLGRPVEGAFSWIEPIPAGSASIAQSHRATTIEGDSVILKVVKPGIRETLKRDARLLGMFGIGLQIILPRYQPRRVLNEFTEYTLREVDLEREADNAETFAANFKDEPDVRFPRIYRGYSASTILCMEFFDGIRPDEDAAETLTEDEKDRVIDLGVSSIIRMLYRDGFFHADLHPGNLLVLPGPQAGFIDLGMVGRLTEEVRRSLLYYYYCLVTGDPASAARYLTSVAEPAPGGDLDGFRREVEEVSRRWQRASSFEDFSFAQLILESVSLGAQFRVYFPIETVLMTKALVTFEAVGNMLKPGFDVAEASKGHITRIILYRFSPWRLARESLRGAPELIDAMVKAPTLVSEGLRLLEHSAKRRTENPFAGVRGTIFGGFCLVAAAILAAGDGPWPLWTALLVIGLIAGLNKRE
ncbi:MAG: AarF/ABC1/UbiB kinase family protein [bacterium]|nr:AarF/ABC1/UbiB kinase family protein [bacterium]